MFTMRAWKTILLLFLFVCTFLALMPQALSNASGKMPSEGYQQTSPLSPLAAPLQSALAVPNSAETKSNASREDEAETKAAIVPIEGPIIIGTEANQTSFVLLGAVLIGLIIVVGLVLGRRN